MRHRAVLEFVIKMKSVSLRKIKNILLNFAASNSMVNVSYKSQEAAISTLLLLAILLIYSLFNNQRYIYWWRTSHQRCTKKLCESYFTGDFWRSFVKYQLTPTRFSFRRIDKRSR